MSEQDNPKQNTGVCVPPGPELRRAALDRVAGYVCKDRQATHGDAEDNFKKIGDYWALYKGVPFTPGDVAAMMALVKIARMATSPNHLDNWDDLAGYAICGAGIADKNNRTTQPAQTKTIDKSKAKFGVQSIVCANCKEVSAHALVERPPEGYSIAAKCNHCNHISQYKYTSEGDSIPIIAPPHYDTSKIQGAIIQGAIYP